MKEYMTTSQLPTHNDVSQSKGSQILLMNTSLPDPKGSKFFAGG